jgi:hypothetical protein
MRRVTSQLSTADETVTFDRMVMMLLASNIYKF